MIWLAPLFLYIILPFELPIKVDFYYVAISILSIASILLIDFFKKCTRLFLNPKYDSKDEFFFKFLLLCSYLYIPVIIINFYSSGVDLSSSFGANRNTFTSGDGGILSQLSVLFSGALVLSVMMYNNVSMKGNCYKKHLIFLSLFIVICNLIVGNRQILNIFAFVFLIKYFIINDRINLLSKKFFLFSFILVFIISFMLWFQFKRQDFVVGGISGQMDFLYSISNIECTAKNFCNSIFAAPFLYIFQYYGNEYHGLTAVLSLDVDSPIFSQTLPVVYRRYSDFMGLPTQEEIRQMVHGAIENKYNIFPRFWSTMYSQIYLDFGWFGIITFNVIITCCITYNRVKFYLFGNYVNYLNYVFCLFFMTFGLMFFPLVEPLIFFMLLFLMAFNIIKKLKIK
ncbi:O-antigen polymerase [Aeromonas veronii]|uniref:O-antigen polymerase n=1 Tax=Aeromonas veronii TaxID=654 RepID=UPI00214DB482|nr:O-antigen polymerase [Aeromonas veronii]MCR3969143.1 oligosaccharide repeat unit polymerase [Aeromonas veronii]MCR3981622.1 oligosaccharide repeat unit polymerase [Aeromonas veronii]